MYIYCVYPVLPESPIQLSNCLIKSKNHRYPICGPPSFFFFNSSLLWDDFIINSVEQLQTLPKTQSEIDISSFLKTQNTSSTRVFVFLEMGLYRSRIEFLVMFEVVQHCL